jgi:hypothetical protein
MKKIALGILSTTVLACGALAGDEVSSKSYTAPVTPSPCFKDQELQLDIFGSFIDMARQEDYHHDFDHHHDLLHSFDHGHDFDHHGRRDDRYGGGGGLGVNYFFTRYVGVGVDGDVNSTYHGLWDVTGKVIFRYPLELGRFCMAPYIFGGGGVQADGITVGTGVAGGGLDFRVSSHVGIFAEGRYTWGSSNFREEDNAQARLGLRIAF